VSGVAGANPARGEAALRVNGEALVLRPTFAALVAAEGELGPLFALVERAADGQLGLTELAVQTSSYGTQIPKLFGTIRVAGTVIWSTDLIETRSKTGGSKGQPSTATYSYSASFAVLLSARAIRDVRRIWAEGKLLRGAAGDWKAVTGFRLYLGGEDQPVDPLIASADPTTPAYRGCAYAVFEGLQLADFGMIADAGVSGAPAATQRTRAIAALETVPRTLSVAHHDPARDYQIGVQQATRPGPGTRADRIELPAVLSATAARDIAERALAEAEAMRTQRTVSVGMDAIGIAPGTTARIDAALCGGIPAA
jgi:hypothetical protein